MSDRGVGGALGPPQPASPPSAPVVFFLGRRVQKLQAARPPHHFGARRRRPRLQRAPPGGRPQHAAHPARAGGTGGVEARGWQACLAHRPADSQPGQDKAAAGGREAHAPALYERQRHRAPGHARVAAHGAQPGVRLHPAGALEGAAAGGGGRLCMMGQHAACTRPSSSGACLPPPSLAHSRTHLGHTFYLAARHLHPVSLCRHQPPHQPPPRLLRRAAAAGGTGRDAA